MVNTYVYNPAKYYGRAKMAMRSLEADELAAIHKVLKTLPFRVTKAVAEDVMVGMTIKGEPVRHFDGVFSAIRHKNTNYGPVMEAVRKIIVDQRRLPADTQVVQGAAKEVLHNFFRARMEEYLQKRGIKLYL